MKIPTLLRKIEEYIFLGILFLYVYSPPFGFLPLNISRIISLLSIVGLLLLYKKQTFQILRHKYIGIALILFFTSFIYSLIIDSLSLAAKGYISSSPYGLINSNTLQQFLILIELFPSALFICIYSTQRLKFNYIEFVLKLAVIATVQSIISIIMFLNPSLRIFILTRVLDYEFATSKIFTIYSLRGFGISSDYLFSMPVFQGIALLCIISWYLWHPKGRLIPLAFTIILIAFSIFLNARIGIVAIPVIFLVGMWLTTFSAPSFRLLLSKKVLSIIFVLPIAMIFGVFLLSQVPNSDSHIERVNSLIEDIISLVVSEDPSEEDTIFSILLNNHLHFPKNIFLGEGNYVFRNPISAVSSDIGIVQNIYFGGVIYLIILLFANFLLFLSAWRLRRRRKLAYQVLICSVFVFVLLSHCKGNGLLPKPGYKGFFLVSIYPVAETCFLIRKRSH